jgi:hypothetical protein
VQERYLQGKVSLSANRAPVIAPVPSRGVRPKSTGPRNGMQPVDGASARLAGTHAGGTDVVYEIKSVSP